MSVLLWYFFVDFQFVLKLESISLDSVTMNCGVKMGVHEEASDLILIQAVWFNEGMSMQNSRSASYTVSRHQNLPAFRSAAMKSTAVRSHANRFTDQRHYSLPSQSDATLLFLANISS